LELTGKPILIAGLIPPVKKCDALRPERISLFARIEGLGW